MNNDTIKNLIEIAKNPKYNYIELNMTIASNIISIYTENGITKNEFRNKIGVSKKKLNKWLSGNYSFNTKEIAKIAQTLDVNFRHLTLYNYERQTLNKNKE